MTFIAKGNLRSIIVVTERDGLTDLVMVSLDAQGSLREHVRISGGK